MIENRLALIDADYLLYVVTNNKKDSEYIKTFDDCKAELDAKILEILVSTKTSHYILALTWGKNFRYSIFPEYKIHRKKQEKPTYFNECREYLVNNYNAFYDSNLEADDIVNICKHSDIEGFTQMSKIIISPDKDILHLEGIHYNPVKQEWVETEELQAKYYLFTSLITGDAADGIKGIPGKGARYAEKKFEEYLGTPIESIVFNEYIQILGEEFGIQEFYKNYMCLKIKDKYEGFQLPKINKFEQAEQFNAEFKG